MRRPTDMAGERSTFVPSPLQYRISMDNQIGCADGVRKYGAPTRIPPPFKSLICMRTTREKYTLSTT